MCLLVSLALILNGIFVVIFVIVVAWLSEKLKSESKIGFFCVREKKNNGIIEHLLGVTFHSVRETKIGALCCTLFDRLASIIVSRPPRRHASAWMSLCQKPFQGKNLSSEKCFDELDCRSFVKNHRSFPKQHGADVTFTVIDI